MIVELSNELKQYNIYKITNIFYKCIEKIVVQSKTKDIGELINNCSSKILEKYWNRIWELILSDFREILKLKCDNSDIMALKIDRYIKKFYNKTKYIDITQIPGKWKKYGYHWYDPVSNKEADNYKPRNYNHN